MARLAGSSKLLRAMNESATMALLIDRGTLTRGELRELTGLSKPTTSDVLRTLTEAGLAIVVGHTSGGPGPNAEVYAVNPAAATVLAISVRDVSETLHAPFEAALCDLGGAVLARAAYPSDPADGDPVGTVRAIAGDLCARAGLAGDRVTHLHLGVPGSYDPGTGAIRHIDVTGWGRPGLVPELAAALGVTVEADNDVNLAAIAERHRGAAAGSGSFALLWLGAGLGCAIDLGTSLLRGATGGAGEIGYVPLGLAAPGQPRDLQSLAGGPAVAALGAAHGFTGATPEEMVADAARADSPAAADFLAALADRIAVVLAVVAALVDPPLVVLAGEVAQAGGPRLRDLVTEAFHRNTPLRTPVEVTALTDDAVLLGAMDSGLRSVRESLVDSLNARPIPGPVLRSA
ncbi:ROK family transcriptional regulator [Catellatospora paridis]|uniref:ROK family transcriptional regulator n=1 Tax=Catellatospora paridis TaxID=1617086 RepID=UPI0012D48402|nr:ROK family protein [Catellatospora paridis]